MVIRIKKTLKQIFTAVEYLLGLCFSHGRSRHSRSSGEWARLSCIITHERRVQHRQPLFINRSIVSSRCGAFVNSCIHTPIAVSDNAT